MEYENIEKVKRLDFDRLDMLVSERIGALKMLAQGMQERAMCGKLAPHLPAIDRKLNGYSSHESPSRGRLETSPSSAKV